jgi:hypothetical protein
VRKIHPEVSGTWRKKTWFSGNHLVLAVECLVLGKVDVVLDNVGLGLGETDLDMKKLTWK